MGGRTRKPLGVVGSANLVQACDSFGGGPRLEKQLDRDQAFQAGWVKGIIWALDSTEPREDTSYPVSQAFT